MTASGDSSRNRRSSAQTLQPASHNLTAVGSRTLFTDAHLVALVGTRMAGLRPTVDDDQFAVLRILLEPAPLAV